MDPQTAIQVATGVATTVAVNNVLSKENMSKLLGPMFKAYGDDLGLWSEEKIQRRRENAARVVIKAQKKLGHRINEPGSVHPKVWKEVFDDGSYAEDELASDYFGGVLASSRTGVDRDDRGATFAKLVGRLSVYELRTHYIFYSHLKQLFNGSSFAFGTSNQRKQLALFIPVAGYTTAMELDGREEQDSILGHVYFGLLREDLVGDYASVSSHESLKNQWPEAPSSGLILSPSVIGVELFLWAHGQGQLPVDKFLLPDTTLDSDVDIPLIEGVMPRFPAGE